MPELSVHNKIFPILVLLLAVTCNSFSGHKKVVLHQRFTVSTTNSHPHQSNRPDAEVPQNAEGQENDDKIEDGDDPFMMESFIAEHINHLINHIYEIQIGLYHEHHQVIFSPPPEA